MKPLHTKSKDRVATLGEVYTPANVVNEMIDIVMEGKDMSEIGLTFFEPSCGNGNFVVELVSRRLNALYLRFLSEGKEFSEGRACIEAVQSVWAIDIDESNIIEARTRVFNLIYKWLVGKVEDPQTYMNFIVMVIADRIFQNECLTALEESDHEAKRTSLKTTRLAREWYEERGWLPMPFSFGR